MKRTAKKLSVVINRTGFGGRTMWQLPDRDQEPRPARMRR